MYVSAGKKFNKQNKRGESEKSKGEYRVQSNELNSGIYSLSNPEEKKKQKIESKKQN